MEGGARRDLCDLGGAGGEEAGPAGVRFARRNWGLSDASPSACRNREEAGAARAPPAAECSWV